MNDPRPTKQYPWYYWPVAIITFILVIALLPALIYYGGFFLGIGVWIVFGAVIGGAIMLPLMKIEEAVERNFRRDLEDWNSRQPNSHSKLS